MEQMLITWGVVVLLAVTALLSAWPMLKRRLARRVMERTIASSGLARLRNVLLDDGMGGQSFYEWLLLTPDGIRVLATSKRNGIIFAGERLDTWAQVLGKRTIRFDNPLYSLEESLSTLRYQLPKLSVEGRILFVADCSFPKGRPEQVLTTNELGLTQNKQTGETVQPEVQQAWEKLQGMVRKVDPVSESYLLPVRESPAYGRWLLIALLLMAAGVWLLWRYSEAGLA